MGNFINCINKRISMSLLMLITLIPDSFAMLKAELINQKQLTNTIVSVVNNSKKINQQSLSEPYNYLLTQPLMTLGIKKFYQRTPIIEKVVTHNNLHNNTYSRVILMIIDTNKARDNAKQALKINEHAPVELGIITINFNALPNNLIQEILHSSIPFGQLLVNYDIKTLNTNRSYFSIICHPRLVALMNCELNSKLYGRHNTLIRKDNKQWVAQVIEILSLIKKKCNHSPQSAPSGRFAVRQGIERVF